MIRCFSYEKYILFTLLYNIVFLEFLDRQKYFFIDIPFIFLTIFKYIV